MVYPPPDAVATETAEVEEAKVTETPEVERGLETKEVSKQEDGKEGDDEQPLAEEKKDQEEGDQLPPGTKNAPRAGRLIANKWAVISVCVQPSQGKLSTYVDGSLCSIAEDLDPADLRLQHRIVILGGGKQAHVRGGDIRRVTIHNSSLGEPEVKDLYFTLSDRNPAVGGLWPKVQARVRGYLTRKKSTFRRSLARPHQDGDGDEEGGEGDEDEGSDDDSDY